MYGRSLSVERSPVSQRGLPAGPPVAAGPGPAAKQWHLDILFSQVLPRFQLVPSTDPGSLLKDVVHEAQRHGASLHKLADDHIDCAGPCSEVVFEDFASQVQENC